MNTILVVDDAPENIRLLKAILTSAEYNVKVAISGKRCLEVLEKSELPDLILLDIMMPEMDGYEVIQKLKSNERTKKIPVIFVTTKDEVGDEKKGLELGAVDFITKPINQIITLSRIKTHLELYRYSQTLEKMVEHKTHEILLHKEKLFQQSKLAAMGEMIDAIAHQWLQPITIIKLDTDMMALEFEDGIVDFEYLEGYKQSLNKQLEHMMSTLKEFRSFLKPTKRYEEFQAKEMFENILSLLQDELVRHQVQVKIDTVCDISLYGVKNEIIHLFINLINNAKDAYRDNKIQDRVISISIDADEKRKIIEVADNAGGIPEEIIGDIFKANVTTKDETKGSGIGLYMSMQIAQKYNANLEVCNINSGAKFTFSLPIDDMLYQS